MPTNVLGYGAVPHLIILIFLPTNIVNLRNAVLMLKMIYGMHY